MSSSRKIHPQPQCCRTQSPFPYYFTFWLSLLLVKHVHKAINLVFDEVRGSCKPCLHDLRYVEEMLKRAKIWNLYAFQVYERYLILESYLDFFKFKVIMPKVYFRYRS